MHDNAPCHRSKAVQSFLNQQRINMLEWPGNSLDLNLKTNFLKSIPLPCVAIKTLLSYFRVFLEKGYHFCRSPTALKAPDRSKQCHCLQFAKCNAGLLYYFKSLSPLGCDSTIVLAVVRHSAPATIATHLRMIRLRRVLTDHPLQ